MIITKGQNVHNKGEIGTYTLDIDSLLAVPKVSSDAYYSDSDNWNSVTICYLTSMGQTFNLVFNVRNNVLVKSKLLPEYVVGVCKVAGILISSEGKKDLLLLRNAIPDVEDLDIATDVSAIPLVDIGSIDGSEITLVAESSDFQVGYAVRLFDSETETYSGTFIITDVDGLVITLNGSPVGSFDQLTFADVQDQVLEQLLNYSEEFISPFGLADLLTNMVGSARLQFDGDNAANAVLACDVDENGNVFLGGNLGFTSLNSGRTRSIRFLKYLSDGLIDNAFMTNAGSAFTNYDTVQKFNGLVRVIKVQPDGKILVGGDFTNYNATLNNYLIRLNSDGTTDTSFVSNASSSAKFNSSINSIAIQSDGKILVGGFFSNYGGTSGRSRLVRLNSDGTLDTTFTSNASDSTKFSAQIRAIAIQSDGKVLVVGDFTNYGGTTGRNYLVRLNADGTLDTAFCNNAVDDYKFNSNVLTVAIQSTGRIIVGGGFNNYGGTTGRNYAVAFNSDGTVDSAFCVNYTDSAKINASVLSVSVQLDDKILTSGIFTMYSGSSLRRYVFRSNSNGTLDNTYNDVVNGNVTSKFNSSVALVVHKNNVNYYTGTFANYIPNTFGYSAAIGFSAVDGTISKVFQNTDRKLSQTTYLFDLVKTSDNGFLMCGSFINYSNITSPSALDRCVPFNQQGQLNSPAITNFQGKFNNIVRAMEVQPDGKILIGGFFSSFDGVGGRDYFIRLNANFTQDTSFIANATNGSKFSAPVWCIAIQPDGKILVGGNFANYGGTTGRNRLVRLNSDGTLDTAFCNNAVDGSKFSASTESNVAAVRCITVQSDGKILVGGNFNNYGGFTYRDKLIRLNADGTLDTAFCNNAVDDYKFNFRGGTGVKSIDVQSDGKILAAGDYANYNGTTGRNFLVRLNADGTLDTAFCNNAVDGNKFNSTLYAVKVLPNGKIMCGGFFSSYAGDTTITCFVRLNSNGTLDSTCTGFRVPLGPAFGVYRFRIIDDTCYIIGDADFAYPIGSTGFYESRHCLTAFKI